MNCTELRERLVETARGRELSSDQRALVFEHAAGCAECSRELERQRVLTTAFAYLATNAPEAPARIGQALMREMPIPIRRQRLSWYAAAAAALLAFGIFAYRPVGQPPAMPANPGIEAVADGGSSAVVENEDFVALPYAASLAPEEPTDIVRVQFSREELLAAGFPVNSEQFGDLVQADVLVGLDGAPRAIRIVND